MSDAAVVPPFPPEYRASGLLVHMTSLPSPYGIQQAAGRCRLPPCVYGSRLRGNVAGSNLVVVCRSTLDDPTPTDLPRTLIYSTTLKTMPGHRKSGKQGAFMSERNLYGS